MILDGRLEYSHYSKKAAGKKGKGPQKKQARK